MKSNKDTGQNNKNYRQTFDQFKFQEEILRTETKNMNIYNLRAKWKFFLLVCAIAIGVCSLLYTNYVVGKLSAEDRKKIEIWAEATRMIAESDIDDANLDFYLYVIENNTTIPVIIVDKNQQMTDRKSVV